MKKGTTKGKKTKPATEVTVAARRRTKVPSFEVNEPSGVYEVVHQARQRTVVDFQNEFQGITGLSAEFNNEYSCELAKLVAFLASRGVRPLIERRREFVAHVNWKFRLNSEGLAAFYAAGASHGFTFNYHQKRAVQRAFDLRDRGALEAVLRERMVPEKHWPSLLARFTPVDENVTLDWLRRECEEPSKLRIEKGSRDIRGEIIKAQFSAFMWVSLPERSMHEFFDPHFEESDYRESFWEQLHLRAPHLFNRDGALHVVRLGQETVKEFDAYDELRSAISSLCARLYDRVNNYGFFAVVVDPMELAGRRIEWEVVADLMIYAEKHREVALKKGYFRPKVIREMTVSGLPNVDVDAARFDLVNEGFTYRDCFVCASIDGRVERRVLLFQKNDRDDTLIPCPACRSELVQGNSYSSIGVRSWECNNLLCPDRSKYNRGKRYSFRGLAMQQAIDDDRNTIPVPSVKRWVRDVVEGMHEAEIADMLVRHYSMFGDTVHVYGWPSFAATELGRECRHHHIRLGTEEQHFWDGPFFSRYVVTSEKEKVKLTNLGDERFKVMLGDSARVLRSIESDTIDGAVTSPPYYNAREYSQWPNMYCHLGDMYDINREVYRVLKPGAVYLYNVFDYFDNENTVVQSAMGQRRMLLSAYTVDLFRRIGFELLSNVVWDKGDIEGKRGFNAGNNSPYYQAPFNCWEHILVFSKPLAGEASNVGLDAREYAKAISEYVLKLQPVIKMVRGKNVHGHTAPFPDLVPEMLVKCLPPDATVLDPFGGSLTTGRVADALGRKSVCIEQSAEYCALGLRLREQGKRQRAALESELTLFEPKVPWRSLQFAEAT